MERLWLITCLLVVTFIYYVNSIRVDEARREIGELFARGTYKDYYKENIINVASWADGTRSARDLCHHVNTLKPMIIGFQGLEEIKMQPLIDCLGNYNHVAGRTEDNTLNPIFYRASTFIRKRDEGSFWLSKDPSRRAYGRTMYGTCTWIRINFAERTRTTTRTRTNKRRKVKSRILRLLMKYAGKTPHNDRVRKSLFLRSRRQIRRVYTTYTWRTVYIFNTQLNKDDSERAVQQIKHMKEHLYNAKHIMDRRRHPVIFMGDVGWDEESDVYEELINSDSKNLFWLIDAMKFATKTFPGNNKRDNFIMENSLTSLLSASIDNGPIYAAFLTQNSPTKGGDGRNERAVSRN